LVKNQFDILKIRHKERSHVKPQAPFLISIYI
jgi:hypothetical protein